MHKLELYWIDPSYPADHFPDLRYALTEPNGLLAFGGDLSTERLIAAYERGIFPWYSKDEPILWWSPDPRSVIFPEQFKPSRSLKKTIRKRHFNLTIDTCFADIIKRCSEPRSYSTDTWITQEMMDAYIQLNEYKIAHSVEVWRQDELVGGLYGVSLGKAFFGESMFSMATDASKVALAYLVEQLKLWGFKLIDCQVSSDHMASLGAIDISRDEFMRLLSTDCSGRTRLDDWKFDSDITEKIIGD
ncbi:MAG: leucyl/phenylalanyl-tRNA--protein transferase [Gammaproteobacteria bacterium]|nr:MAG: leucyl/phenylalanyl-tRNA--protein transferase [Gammaproteobacteria bacterium]